jgi:hypothetical protein
MSYTPENRVREEQVPAAGGDGCEPPAYPVPPGDERDGDGDGCAGEE